MTGTGTVMHWYPRTYPVVRQTIRPRKGRSTFFQKTKFALSGNTFNIIRLKCEPEFVCFTVLYCALFYRTAVKAEFKVPVPNF